MKQMKQTWKMMFNMYLETVALCRIMYAGLFHWLVNVQTSWKLYLQERPAKAIVCAATQRQKLQIKLAISSNHSILAKPVLALTSQPQVPGWEPVDKLLIGLDPREQGVSLVCLSPARHLTTGPAKPRQCMSAKSSEKWLLLCVI